ncbi:hypothetical protein HUK65_17850 [Rhodobacteraceae bacterium 2376]|uniref:RapA2 cadherin-like domain-containing protein n=1 Tax=Rhabdonatronobacter sediminivivens TaxID=2743469 RepID=A0A7Z0KZL3_9RHOB|nr:VCBS domain-containing protein [Rhabdonatronobacter sediminivivens]NYS26827.1 hypothetical protein [Rhabdonatronobacter sediminivivens]
MVIGFDRNLSYGIFTGIGAPFLSFSTPPFDAWADGTSEATATFYSSNVNNFAGPVAITSVSLRDVDGRETVVQKADLDALGFGTSFDITFERTNDPASIAGDTSGLVVEDDSDRQQANGVLIVTDPDAGEDRFADPDLAALTGSFGAFDFDAQTGAWSYRLHNDATAVQALPQDARVTDTLTVTSLDGTASETITVTVTGVNDPASITGTTTGAVIEDDPVRQVATGVLSITDPDAGEDRFADLDSEALAGNFGSFTFSPDTGAWTYTLDSEAEVVQSLSAGARVTDTLTVTSLDGTATETIEVTVEGTGVRTLDPDATVLLQGFLSDRANQAIEGAEVVFTSAGGDARGASSDASGNFGLILGRGLSGHLDATRDYDPVTDGRLSASDALDVLRLAVGLAPSWGMSRPMDFIAADIDQDGRVTAADALDVLRAAVRLESVHQPRWIFLDAEADLSDIDRTNTGVETGVRIDPLVSGLTEFNMIGILLGNMQEYA